MNSGARATLAARTAMAFVAASASAWIIGCASAEPGPTPTSAASGPSGYVLAADLSDGHQLWYDRGDESSLTDIVIDNSKGQVIAACLGNDPQLCVSGPDDASGMLVIAPAGAERAVANWYGQEVELQRGNGPEGDAPPVFGGVMPPRGAEGSPTVQVFDGAGQAIWP